MYLADYRRGLPRENASARIIGIDGEGQGRANHVYNFLAAADEDGKTWQLGNDRTKQIPTEDCLDFLLDLPGRSLVFAFAFLYDLTKILTDLPDQQLGDLFHEERRLYFVDGRARYRPVRWRGYRLNFINRRFTVQKGAKRQTVWDVFAFFQSKFTKACIDWKVGKESEVRLMEKMKERRSEMDKLPWAEITAYCLTECRNLAQLGRALLDAHDTAGLKLKSYFGCGSTASALMNRHNVRDFKDDAPEKMREPVACAFFGGRFEHDIIGAVRRKVWVRDIGSAYPYALTSMPCLTHGRWKFTKRNLDQIDRAQLALVNWHNPGGSGPNNWGPLPVRKADGTIAFPLAAVEGWAWREEFLAARRMCPAVVARGAWFYTTDCMCRPFSFLPEVYLQRLRLGGDTAGLPLKNGSNSCYGKIVQSLGHAPPFQSFTWGGNCTSHCRAQLLDAIATDPDHVLMVATDSVASDRQLILPEPRDTGTAEALVISKGKKGPLGSWDSKEYLKGMFFVRPGIYFPMEMGNDDEERAKVRARGLGRKVLYDNVDLVMDAWARGSERVELPPVQRFIGAKTGLRLKGNVWGRSDNYGQWVNWPTRVSFDPQPKRRSVLPGGRLECWPTATRASLPYEKAIRNEETEMLRLAQTIAEEQPHGDYVEA